MRRVWAWFLLPVALAAAAGCSLLTNLDDLRGGDAGADAPTDGFDLVVSPGHVTADIGDPAVKVTITVVRAASFTGLVDLSVTGGIGGITASAPPPVLAGSTSSAFLVTVAQGVPPGEYVLVVTGTSGAFPAVQRKLGVRVGSRLVPDDAGVILVPLYASALDVKVWGAGGGGGLGTNSLSQTGGLGGAGGFAGARVPVTGGATLHVFEGGGGAYASRGGGLSGLADDKGGFLLIAGSGGGGGSAQIPGPLVTGGAGGGVVGGNGQSVGGACPGLGGTATAGGAGADPSCAGGGKPGASLVGGDGSGRGGFGGAGYYGGGGGAGGTGPSGPSGGGGGGGSGWVADSGADATLVAGDGGAPPLQSDPDYVQGTGVGGTGGLPSGAAGTAGGSGRVVVRLPRP